MFRISHVLGTHRQHDRRAIAEVQALLVAAFPDLADVPDYVERKLAEQTTRIYPTVLLTAHGPGDKVMGFALADHFEWLGYAYLDFIVTQAEQRGRGLGGGLYEALRQDLVARGAKGLFLEVPTDDPAQVTDPADLKSNKNRLKFYERYDARPIIGTLYDQPIRPGNPLEPRLLFDPLDDEEPLPVEAAREVIATILTLRYNFAPDSDYVSQVVASVKDSPVKIRKPLYSSPEEKKYKIPRRLHPLKVFCSSRHALHHVRERGYVERPARVDVILKALDELPDVQRLPVRNFGEGPIRAVHDADFVNYVRDYCQELPEGELVYPYVFPIRRADRPPHDRRRRVGYYCIDTFTPLSKDAYKAARAAVNVALSGASAIVAGGAPGLQPMPTARPSCRTGYLWRVLLLRQRGDRRPVFADQARRAGGDPRRRLPPRQRLAGHLLGAVRRPDRLDPRPPELRLSLLLGLRRRGGRGGGQGVQPQPAASPKTSTTAGTSKSSTRPWRSSASSTLSPWSSRSAWTSPRPTPPAPGA